MTSREPGQSLAPLVKRDLRLGTSSMKSVTVATMSDFDHNDIRSELANSVTVSVANPTSGTDETLCAVANGSNVFFLNREQTFHQVPVNGRYWLKTAVRVDFC